MKPDEWATVADFIWRHRAGFTGVALLSHDGDKRYPQAPREAAATEEDVAPWNRLKYHPVDDRQLAEQTVDTALKDVAACASKAECSVGSTVAYTVQRGNATKSIKVKLEKMPADATARFAAKKASFDPALAAVVMPVVD